MGETFLKSCGYENVNNQEYFQVELEEGAVPVKVKCSRYQERTVLYLLLQQGDTNILFGMGNNNKFKKLEYSPDLMQFVDVDCFKSGTFALTDDGELYAWGNLSIFKDAMWFPTIGKVSTPTLVGSLRNYRVRNFKCSDEHVIVWASSFDDPNTVQYLVLNTLRFGSISAIRDGVYHIDILKNKKCDFIECGSETFFFKINKQFQVWKVDKTPQYSCSVTKKPIPEKFTETECPTIHFYQNELGEWQFLSREGYEQIKDQLPDIVYACQSPISNLHTWVPPKLRLEDILEENKDTVEPKYISKSVFSSIDEVVSDTYIDEKRIFELPENDFVPKIYYRLAKPLAKDAHLPYIKMTKLMPRSNREKFTLGFTPDYSHKINQKVIDLDIKKYESLLRVIEHFSQDLDDELLKMIDDHIQSKDIDFFANQEIQIDCGDVSFEDSKLKGVDKMDLQHRIDCFVDFNKQAVKLLPFVKFGNDLEVNISTGYESLDQEMLSKTFMKTRSLIFTSVKNKYIRDITDTIKENGSEAGVTLNRMWIMHNKDQGRVDHNAEWTTFATVMKACKATNYSTLIKKRSNTKSWNATMLGEGSVDAGGPFRDSVTNIVEELHSKCLPLLIPSQNNKNNHGFNRDCWTINPTSKSSTHLEMYEFLGALMGTAFMSGSVIDMKLPPIFWKTLIGEELTIADLRGSDAYAVQTIEALIENKKNYTKEIFDEATDLNFTTQLSNGDTVSLIEGGEERRVLYEDVEEYNQLVLKFRFSEADMQIEKIKQGFNIIFPIDKVGILSWKDIEARVRGPSEISVSDLKQMTTYCGYSKDSETIVRFWRVVEGFNQAQKESLLKFISGRSRLPPKERQQDAKFQIYSLSVRDGMEDQTFPQAHTCFYQIDIPKYSTDEICRDKLIMASELCGEIDTDNGPTGIANAGGNYE